MTVIPRDSESPVLLLLNSILDLSLNKAYLVCGNHYLLKHVPLFFFSMLIHMWLFVKTIFAIDAIVLSEDAANRQWCVLFKTTTRTTTTHAPGM